MEYVPMEASVLDVNSLDSGFQILCQQIKEAIYKWEGRAMSFETKLKICKINCKSWV